MRHEDKLPGKTVAESLGLDIPDNAPGGQRLPSITQQGAQRSSKASGSMGTDLEYDGFQDLDAYRRADQ